MSGISDDDFELTVAVEVGHCGPRTDTERTFATPDWDVDACNPLYRPARS